MLLFGCAHYTPLPAPAQRFESAGLSEAQRAQLSALLAALFALKPEELQIPAAEYRLQTRFVERFGFELDGPRLWAWLLSRVHRLRLGDPWTVAVYDGAHTIEVGPRFFSLPRLDQLFILIHEARHDDDDAPMHVACPPELGLGDLDACDSDPRGAYGSQAALLFELYAYGLVDPSRARYLWRDSLRRLWTQTVPKKR